MSIASRMTMSNMSVELGAKFGFFEPDQRVVEYLKGRAKKAYSRAKPTPMPSMKAYFRSKHPGLNPR